MDTESNGTAPHILKAQTQYRVPYGDTDAMGVVYYGKYLLYFEMVCNELMRKVGFPYTVMEARGFGLPVLEAHVDYKSSARYDDIITIEAAYTWAHGVRMRVDCRITSGNRLVATGYTLHCCLDMKTRRPARIVPELLGLAPDMPANP